MPKLKPTTLLFLVKKENGEPSEICLARKKIGQGIGKWNGVGGKVEKDETIENAAIRETKEEIGVDVTDYYEVARIDFLFPEKPEWDQEMNVYISENWNGEPSESDEMAPKWFKISDIPYKEMWSDDIYWLPEVLKGKYVKANFKFDKDEQITEKQIQFLKKRS